MTKEVIIYNGEKTVSSISGARKTGQIHAKEWNYFLTLYPRINWKWSKDLNVRLYTMKLLEENVGITSFDINYSNIFLNSPPRVIKTKTKINKLDLKVFFHSKGNHKQNKKTTHRMRENICKWSKWQAINLQNVHIIHAAQRAQSQSGQKI